VFCVLPFTSLLPGAPSGRFEESPLDWSPVAAAPAAEISMLVFWLATGAGLVSGGFGPGTGAISIEVDELEAAAGAAVDVDVEVVSSEPAAAPEFAELTEPDPLKLESRSIVVLLERCRMEVVSAVLDVVPVSERAASPILSLPLLLQPTSATMHAAVNKYFFIRISFVCENAGRRSRNFHPAFSRCSKLELSAPFQYEERA
jgi:hypothetical protein